MRLLFFIGSLGTGGAEKQISQLAYGLAKINHQVFVVTVYPGGQNWEWLKKHRSVTLISLFSNKNKTMPGVFYQLCMGIFRLHKIVIKENVDVVYSALYMSNLLAWFALRGINNVKLIWGIRASNMKLNWKRFVPFYVCSKLSSGVDMIIANSKAGLEYHKLNGYRSPDDVVVPNGIDTDKFKFNNDYRIKLRSEWGCSAQVKLIGIVGRLDPMKDHQTFLYAAEKLSKERNDAYFICVGDGPEKYKQELLCLTEELGLSDRIIWAGKRTDTPAVYSALDIAISSSAWGEGFPNVIGEAMSCGIPCVVTDVGDSAWVVADTGFIIQSNQPIQLADACKKILDLTHDQYKDLSSNSRHRIKSEFTIINSVISTEKALMRCLN